MDLSEFVRFWHHFDEFLRISTLFDTLACPKIQERVLSTTTTTKNNACGKLRHLSASGVGERGRGEEDNIKVVFLWFFGGVEGVGWGYEWI